MSLTPQVSNPDLHDEWQWLTAITPHWLHQLPTVGEDKYITICSKFCANNYTKICILSFHHIFRSNMWTKSWCWLALKRLNSPTKSNEDCGLTVKRQTERKSLLVVIEMRCCHHHFINPISINVSYYLPHPDPKHPLSVICETEKQRKQPPCH